MKEVCWPDDDFVRGVTFCFVGYIVRPVVMDGMARECLLKLLHNCVLVGMVGVVGGGVGYCEEDKVVCSVILLRQH